MASEEALKPVDDAEKAGNARWQQRTGHVYIYIHNIYIYIYILYDIYIYILLDYDAQLPSENANRVPKCDGCFTFVFAYIYL